MRVTALVMAGGKATRMNAATEKPLLEVGGKSMIEHVVDALKQSKTVDRIIVAVSKGTPRTARKASELNTIVLETPGIDYICDVKYAVKKLGLQAVLTVSADLPFITSEIVDRAVEKYMSSGKPSLAVMSPVETYERLGSKPEHIFEVDGRNLVPVGINIIDGSRIDEPELEETILVTDSEELALNVNTPSDLEVARERFKKATGYGAHQKGDETSTPRRAPRTYRPAHISVFSALSLIGLFIHPPSPIQTVSFDSSPGFLAALCFGALDGASVSRIGHIITSIINSSPLGMLHPPMALGLGGALAFLSFLFLAASLNGIVAALAYVGVRGRLGS